ncbi:hypothetical protein SAMN04487975_1043 [Planococcus glaciei]|uniref:hypothetical protein n=1 Tax=Planococcus glaciei TaxID=459472 RepID=UPI0008834C97|nr:hypothetical protein [Planococcus glaciei]SDH30974.1 hypothetical protein SAMN04487975_1043 [Planococcus glaciei]
MRTIRALTESYDEAFGTKTQVKHLYKYSKTANWKVKTVFLLLPLLLMTAFVFFLLEKPTYSTLTIIFVYILPNASKVLIEKDIQQNELLDFKDFDKGLKQWKVLIKEKSTINLDILENILAVEEIVRYEIEYEVNKPTFLSYVAIPTKNLMFPIASFVTGLYISEYVTDTMISNVVMLLVIGFLGVFAVNYMRFSYYDFTKIYKIQDILALIHECKVRNSIV